MWIVMTGYEDTDEARVDCVCSSRAHAEERAKELMASGKWDEGVPSHDDGARWNQWNPDSEPFVEIARVPWVSPDGRVR